MSKVLCLLLTLLMFPIMSNSTDKINLEDHIKLFSWDKRIILLIAKEKYRQLINETDDFFERSKCKNEERNLKYIRIVGDDLNKYFIPERYVNKYGIWLIGYDGEDKSYSSDTSLLEEIHNIIDSMAIRKIEMTAESEKCN